ncbi:MAG: hypothetical protein [Diaphorina citri cimodo-like virus]|nr:MAG: hypothetical protein [Diaphorina citri cimodo-like virus]
MNNQDDAYNTETDNEDPVSKDLKKEEEKAKKKIKDEKSKNGKGKKKKTKKKVKKRRSRNGNGKNGKSDDSDSFNSTTETEISSDDDTRQGKDNIQGKKSKSVSRSLKEPDEAILPTSNAIDKLDDIVESKYHSIREKEKIERRKAEALNLIKDANEWDQVTYEGSVPYIKIVNEIPSIVDIKKKDIEAVDTDLLAPLPSSFDALSFIKNSCAMFTSNTQCVSYQIKTKGTYASLEYDPETLLESTIKLNAFNVIGADGVAIDNAEHKTRMLAGLLEMVLKMRVLGDVFIKSVPMVTIQNSEINAEPLRILKGKNVPREMPPHIYFSMFRHDLIWFVRDIHAIVPEDEIRIGEHDGITKVTGVNAKLCSYVATTTDSIFATLHHLFMAQHETRKLNARIYTQAISAIAPPGSSLTHYQDIDLDLWEGYQPNQIDVNRYVFSYMLSSTMRQSNFSYLTTLASEFQGISEVSTDEQLIGLGINVTSSEAAGQIRESLLSVVRGYSLNHFYQAMVMEVNHAIIEPNMDVDQTYTSLQSSCFALLAAGLDAICFPATFWTNINLYALVIYRACAFINAGEYPRMILNGYTASHPYVIPLSRQQLLEGEVPLMMMPGNAKPPLYAAYYNALVPVGEVIELGIGQSQWCPNITADRACYIPFSKGHFDIRTINVDTAFSTRVAILITALEAMINDYGRRKPNEKRSTSSLTSMLSALNAIRYPFGSCAHFELNYIYRVLFNGPETVWTTYRGAQQPNLVNRIGLISSDPNVQGSGLPTVNFSKAFFGIGLWALISIIPNRAKIDSKTSLPSLVIGTPMPRFQRFMSMVQSSLKIGDSFGIANYLLTLQLDDDSPWSYMMNVFGPNIKAGLTSDILRWLAGEEEYNKLFNPRDHNVLNRLFLDWRLRQPIFSLISPLGNAIANRDRIHPVYEGVITLIDQFDALKLEVSLYTMSGANSPFHRIIDEVVFAFTSFSNFSPDNRHPEPDVTIIYDTEDETVGSAVFGTDNRVYFTVNGNRWYDMEQEGFPERVRVEVENPIRVRDIDWAFLWTAIQVKGWQVYFKNLTFIATVKVITYQSANAASALTARDWDVMKQASEGQIIPITFYDTTSSLLNVKTQHKPAGCIQYTCATSPVQRNSLVKGIAGFSQGEQYQPPSRSNWVIGRDAPDRIPADANGTPKYKGDVNFNNYLKCYTANAVLDDAPQVRYLPPSLSSIV